MGALFFTKTRQKAGFLMVPSTGMPSGKIPDGIFLQAGLAVFAFRGFARSNKNIAPPFNPCRTPSSWCATDH